MLSSHASFFHSSIFKFNICPTCLLLTVLQKLLQFLQQMEVSGSLTVLVTGQISYWQIICLFYWLYLKCLLGNMLLLLPESQMEWNINWLDHAWWLNESTLEHLALDPFTRHIIQSHHSIARTDQPTVFGDIERRHSRTTGSSPRLQKSSGEGLHIMSQPCWTASLMW